MKHKIRDLIILLVTISGLAKIYRQQVANNGPLVRVISFHDVADRQWFADILSLLHDKYHVVTPADFKSGTFVTDKINILITFDDGYQTWIDNCLPELEERGFKAIFFVNSGLLDRADDETKVADFYRSKILISPKLPLTWNGVRQLTAAGHTIGSHTVNHVSMANVSSEMARDEVVKDKARFEEMLGNEIEFFAYPFGTKRDYNKETITVVEETGIKYQFSAMTGFTKSTDMAHLIPRTLVENNQSIKSVTRWLDGGYDVFKAMQS